MSNTEAFTQLAKLPVPGSGGDIRIKVMTRKDRSVLPGTSVRTAANEVQTFWITVTFDQFARIMNIVNETPDDGD